MVFENPAFPSGQVLLVHRVVEYLGHGDHVTAGDANQDVDATAVPAGGFRAQARILAPYVGLPLVWLCGHDYLLLGGWLLLTVAAFVRGSRRGPCLGRHHQPRHATSFAALAGLGSGIVPAAAAFTSTTRNPANGWTAGAFLQAYSAAVHGDDPCVYYLLDEADGAAADYSGNDRVGSYASIGAYRQPGTLPNNPGYGGWAAPQDPDARLARDLQRRCVAPPGADRGPARSAAGLGDAPRRSGRGVRDDDLAGSFSGWWRAGYGRLPSGDGYLTPWGSPAASTRWRSTRPS